MPELTVGSIMNSPVYTVSPDTTIVEVVAKMKKYKVGSIVVSSEGRAIGIITGSDVLNEVVARHKQLDKIKAKEIMSTPLTAVEPETTLKEAAQVMSEKTIEKLPIVNKAGDLVGIVTTTDLVAYSDEFLDVMVNLVVSKQQRMGA